MDHPLHTICSYMAMFPPALPNHFIRKYSSEGDVVLDPFSGRGTTVLEACSLNRVGVGNDRNPLAYLLTKVKCNVPHKGRLLSRIEKLEKMFNPKLINIENEDDNIRMIFSDYTLKQLVFLKNNLRWKKSNVDAFIAAMLLGVLHGNSSGYLSVSMPNTFSMSPNYVKNYIAKNGLTKPNRNAFDILRRKLDRCYQRPITRGVAFKQDVTKMTRIRDSTIDLIVTSPPYTRVIRYGQFNWIRLWFLGTNGKNVDENLFFTQSLDKYSHFMTDALREMKRTLKSGGRAIVVIGDVRDKSTDENHNLAKMIWLNCAEPLGFRLEEPIIVDRINDETKVSKIWGERRGNATKTDRILVLQK